MQTSRVKVKTQKWEFIKVLYGWLAFLGCSKFKITMKSMQVGETALKKFNHLTSLVVAYINARAGATIVKAVVATEYTGAKETT